MTKPHTLVLKPMYALLLVIAVTGPIGGDGFSGTAFADGPPSEIDETAVLLDQVPKVLRLYNEDTEYPLLHLDADQLQELGRRKVVILTKKLPLPGREEEDLKYRSMAYRIVDHPIDAVWLAAMAPDLSEGGSVTEVELYKGDHGERRLFGRIALPWPIADRQWVIDVAVDTMAAHRTAGQIWMAYWNLTEDGRELGRATMADGNVPGYEEDDFEKAVYLPANTGAWTLMALDDEHTLLGYQVTLIMGGWIPEALGLRFGRGQLKKLLHTVAADVPTQVREYDPGRYVIPDGFGRPMDRRVAAVSSEIR